jgi:predicted nucleotidyltransferase
LRTVFQKTKVEKSGEGWWVVLDMLQRTDVRLVSRLTRKMLNHLSWAGIEEADDILGQFGSFARGEVEMDENRPSSPGSPRSLTALTETVFGVAGRSLSEKVILDLMQKWIKEDRSGFLVKIIENPASSMPEIVNALNRYHHLSLDGTELSASREQGIRISLIRRLLSDHPEFVGVAKDFIGMKDLYSLLQSVVFPADSHGKLGGKGSGLFLAGCILERFKSQKEILREVKLPRTWYLASDSILSFINYNDLEDVVEQKYEDIDQVRAEYPYIIHVFKNSNLPPDIVNGLSAILDEVGETPLIIRSSSLLEDRSGTSFAGKYKSLFIANQGGKQQRLTALMDAIAEVYASTFGPDPIRYRQERGLIEFHEEMGVLIQEVVGTRVGHYHIPAFAGVAFSQNEFRWSRRLRTSDGLMRMVPGLGTRAVDRVSDDYPILVAPGQPSLRVNVTLDEQIRYSPKRIDVINLRTNSFETVQIAQLLKEYGGEYPMINRLISFLDHDRLREPMGKDVDFEKGHPVVTFGGLIGKTNLVEQIATMLQVLAEEFRTPVDIEFAHDGTSLYLLQCRAQSLVRQAPPVTLPRDVPKDRILFTADKYVATGMVPNVTHIVYVDPARYSELHSREEMLAVGRIVGKLNQLLPKHQFILMGPGRWGSRGDIRLGVSVTYSDINNSSMLIEVARRTRDYVPELSFGTHFFQDLVEASIRYLPLYPDESSVVFNEEFLTTSRNVLAELLPEYEQFSGVVRVIDIPATMHGTVLQIFMNGDQEEALGVLMEPDAKTAVPVFDLPPVMQAEKREENHWRWRLRAAEHLAGQLDHGRFGVKAAYVFGSTKNATAGPQSDIDLLLHFDGSESQRKELLSWLDGWNLSLSYMNYLRTGFTIDPLLDIHLITDDDVKHRTSYAARIGATTDSARPLPIGIFRK